MLLSDWWARVDNNWNSLLNAIASYHPLAESPRNHGPITAPGAEIACEVVRELIRRNDKGNPLDRAETAKQNRDVSEMLSVLNEAWFGAPESRSVYATPGFPTLCDLCSEPPEEEECEQKSQSPNSDN